MSDLYAETFEDYESIEFSLADGQTDYDLDAQQSEFLAVFNQGGVTGAQPRFPIYVKIRTDQTISVRINSTGNDSITIPSTDSPFEIKGVKITNLFLTNSSGSAATVRLLFFIPQV